ncbi:MAG: hypothetical protein ACYSTL_07590 [Planctomycetota bacterium]|jgi:hypothetical protein
MKLIKGIDYRKLTRAERKATEGRFKYEVLRTLRIQTNLDLPRAINSDHGLVAISADGELVVAQGFRSDGPSGPTFDTPSTMRAAFLHDALYWLMREGKIGRNKVRQCADVLLMSVMAEDGAGLFRATLWLWAVRLFAGRSARA